jgi:hypothetical protein
MLKFFKIAVFIIFLQFVFRIEAQMYFKEGFLITNTGDTLYGLIKDRGEIRNSMECLFKENKNAETIKFFPNEIIEYRFNNDKYYVSKYIKPKSIYKWVFAEVLIKGNTSLYKNWEGDYKYFIQEDTILLGLRKKKVIVRRSEFKISSTNNFGINFYSEMNCYRDELYYFLKDSDKLIDEISDVKYNSKSLIDLIKKYINLNCSKNSCVLYEKDFYKCKPTFGIYFGLLFTKTNIIESKVNKAVIGETLPIYSSPVVGIFYNYPFKLIDEKISFQLEFLYNKARLDNFKELRSYNFLNSIDYTTISLPVLIKYSFNNNNNLTPSISVGKETILYSNSFIERIWLPVEKMYVNLGSGWFFDFGIDKSVLNKFHIFSNIRIQEDESIFVNRDDFLRLSYFELNRNKYFNERLQALKFALNIGIRY